MIIAGILFLIAIVSFWFSIRSFFEKGFLLNNSYLYASKQERETMNKKPYYRQSAIVFALLGCIFVLNGFATVFHADWISFVTVAVVLGAIVYAIASSVAIEQKKQK
jgi:hypothetical protein